MTLSIFVLDHVGYEKVFRETCQQRAEPGKVRLEFNDRALGRGINFMEHLPQEPDIYFMHIDNQEFILLQEFKRQNKNKEIFVRLFISPTYDYNRRDELLDGWYSGEQGVRDRLEKIFTERGVLKQ